MAEKKLLQSITEVAVVVVEVTRDLLLVAEAALLDKAMQVELAQIVQVVEAEEKILVVILLLLVERVMEV